MDSVEPAPATDSVGTVVAAGEWVGDTVEDALEDTSDVGVSLERGETLELGLRVREAVKLPPPPLVADAGPQVGVGRRVAGWDGVPESVFNLPAMEALGRAVVERAEAGKLCVG